MAATLSRKVTSIKLVFERPAIDSIPLPLCNVDRALQFCQIFRLLVPFLHTTQNLKGCDSTTEAADPPFEASVASWLKAVSYL